VHIEIKTENESLNVRGSFFHLSKVLINLVSNAAEAMPDGGRIQVSTEMRNIDSESKNDKQIKHGKYAVMCVTDSGIGIPKEDLERIFEPFFTEKTMGRSGTGLGMSIVWNTVKDHHGHITVESSKGKGTKFTVYLPVTNEEVTVSKYPYSQKDITGHGESILVVDDVGDQRIIMVELLKRMGYSVHAVGSGAEAIEYLSRKTVDLLILDMIMDPGMDGLETYKKGRSGFRVGTPNI
jgi:CheY-like chemotaxis protein